MPFVCLPTFPERFKKILKNLLLMNRLIANPLSMMCIGFQEFLLVFFLLRVRNRK
jgi:hypothetical protein